MNGGLLIEWKTDFHKEIVCQRCHGYLLRNKKNVQVVAVIEPFTVVTKQRGGE